MDIGYCRHRVSTIGTQLSFQLHLTLCFSVQMACVRPLCYFRVLCAALSDHLLVVSFCFLCVQPLPIQEAEPLILPPFQCHFLWSMSSSSESGRTLCLSSHRAYSHTVSLMRTHMSRDRGYTPFSQQLWQPRLQKCNIYVVLHALQGPFICVITYGFQNRNVRLVLLLSCI